MKSLSKIYRKLFQTDTLGINEKIVSLSPNGPVRGNVLLSYILEPFLRKEGESISDDHTHYWESFQIAKSFLDKGFAVDVINYENQKFTPSKKYNYFISARTNLERIAKRLNDDCIIIAHLDTAHWLYNNTTAYQRLYALQQRRGITIKNSIRIVEPNLAIEFSDLATILGNQFTIGTYSYANKPIYRIPISSPSLYQWNENKDFDKNRYNYIWFGSSGFVHKGLDLVLEAFSQMPNYLLFVCGPLDREKDFLKAYHKELYEMPNIKTLGWVDVNSSEFIGIADKCIGLVYPSCAEGGGGSAITCMHAGLIPILSYEASVDIGDCGILLNESSIEEIKQAIMSLSSLSATTLKDKSKKTWETAVKRHTREIFAKEYEYFLSKKLLPYRKEA